MHPVINSNEKTHSVMACFEEECALFRSGGYWNCLAAARKLTTLLLADGRSPWVARLRKAVAVGGEVFHAPLIPRAQGVAATWTTHYVCCCDGMAYDPVAGRVIRLETYSLELFGKEIPSELFVPADELQAYLVGS